MRYLPQYNNVIIYSNYKYNIIIKSHYLNKLSSATIKDMERKT